MKLLCKFTVRKTKVHLVHQVKLCISLEYFPYKLKKILLSSILHNNSVVLIYFYFQLSYIGKINYEYKLIMFPVNVIHVYLVLCLYMVCFIYYRSIYKAVLILIVRATPHAYLGIFPQNKIIVLNSISKLRCGISNNDEL